MDGTQLRDAATRFLVNARRHCAIRFNEVHDYQRGIWANAEETYLVHGDVSKGGGRPSAVTPTTLTDGSKRWRPGIWREAEVLIVSGRGFGQHRAVADSTADTLTLRQPHMVRTGFELTPRIDGGIWIGNRSGAERSGGTAARPVALSHTIVAGNSISHTPRGISVSDTARKTFVLMNEFEEVETPILDWGRDTIEEGNRVHTLDLQGERTTPWLPERR